MRMAAYCRVSTEKEEQLSSLENQREFFEQYIDFNNFKPLFTNSFNEIISSSFIIIAYFIKTICK